MMKLVLTALAADDALSADDAAILVVAWVVLFFGVSLAGWGVFRAIRLRLMWMRKLSSSPRIHWKEQLQLQPSPTSSNIMPSKNGNHQQSLIPSAATTQRQAPAELVLFQRMMTSLWNESQLLLSAGEVPNTMVVIRQCAAVDDALLSARLDDDEGSRSRPLDETMESEMTLEDEDDDDDGEEAEIVFDHPDFYNDNNDNGVHHHTSKMTCESSSSSRLGIFANPFSEQYCPNYEQCFQGETDEDEDDDDDYNTPPALQVVREGETSSLSQDGSRLQQQNHQADCRRTSKMKLQPRVESTSSLLHNGSRSELLLLENSVPPCRYSRHDLPPSL